MRTIAAIETQWNGVWFRSRLESRWAILFSTLGVEWQYEPEDFSLASRGYRPDFWLPAQEVWVEIKPEHTPLDHQLAAAIQEQTGSPLLWVAGLPCRHRYQVTLCDFGGVEELPDFTFALTRDGALILLGERDGERCRVGLPPSWASYEHEWSEPLDDQALTAAYTRAMGWRFGP